MVAGSKNRDGEENNDEKELMITGEMEPQQIKRDSESQNRGR